MGTIPSNVVSIGSFAVDTVSVLEKAIFLGQSVTSIGESAFANTDLKSVELPNSIIEIKRGTFQNTKKLESIVIPDSVEYIKQEAFRNSGLTSVSLG